ncbi:MAG: family protein phosphatase [Candidatus Binatota bacterium]|jgi:protein phosphatase|nr:family protein phosphatase [Candidatus Binatota bacterium]
MIDAHARTDVGLVRKNNEDSHFADPARGLLIVADGMGGHAAGEVASRIAVETIAGEVPEKMSWWPFGRTQRERDQLVGAIREANRRVRAAAEKDGTLRGMGTTVVVLWALSGRAHVAHVGDSRLYRFRRGGLVQLTRDHAWPSEDGGFRNVLTRAVGAETDVEVDHRVIDVSPGDVFLLCSDGLSRAVDDAAIVAALGDGRPGDGDSTAARLIELARDRGAPDNVTVILAYCSA